MPDDEHPDRKEAALEDAGAPAPAQDLTPAAERALAEAAERRAKRDADAEKARRQREIDGRGGLDPVRYGDWEVKGLTSDF